MEEEYLVYGEEGLLHREATDLEKDIKGLENDNEQLNILFAEKELEGKLDCQISDCTHTNEKGCAVLAAIENEELDSDSYLIFMKMEKEKIHFESEDRERRKRDKNFVKMIKCIQKARKNNKH